MKLHFVEAKEIKERGGPTLQMETDVVMATALLPPLYLAREKGEN